MQSSLLANTCTSEQKKRKYYKKEAFATDQFSKKYRNLQLYPLEHR